MYERDVSTWRGCGGTEEGGAGLSGGGVRGDFVIDGGAVGGEGEAEVVV